MIDQKLSPEIIRDVNRRFPYMFRHECKGLDQKRRLTIPRKLIEKYGERRTILQSDHLICCESPIPNKECYQIFDYIPDLAGKAEFYDLNFNSQGRLYIPARLQVGFGKLIFLGMRNRFELWTLENLDKYLHRNQNEEAIIRAQIELFKRD